MPEIATEHQQYWINLSTFQLAWVTFASIFQQANINLDGGVNLVNSHKCSDMFTTNINTNNPVACTALFTVAMHKPPF